MLNGRYRKNIVTGGWDGIDQGGTVVERIQPNHVTKGFDRYVGHLLAETVIPDRLGGFNVYREGKLIGRR
jgi:hypothetical protein